MLELNSIAGEMYAEVLSEVDAGRATGQAVRVSDTRLHIAGGEFELRSYAAIYSVATGKAARPMATALSDCLGSRLTGGVISAPDGGDVLPDCWRVFIGGHPLPNEASLAAARAARELLRRADTANALVIFLVSGGGSAMMELPRDARVTLDDLRAANRALVGCGATIAEINSVRRCLSAIKGGGLSRLAGRAAQVTLIVSDTNIGDERNVASGLTLQPTDAGISVAKVLERYGLRRLLPASVIRAIDETARESDSRGGKKIEDARHSYYTLLSNRDAVNAAVTAARKRGFAVETAHDVVEDEISEGCSRLVSRLFEMRRRASPEKVACLISGGEFACRVQGNGTGGRNAEASLRCAIEMASRIAQEPAQSLKVTTLHAGTDGVDGNSPAAGAIADETTLRRAHAKNMDARDYLARSDAYAFFQTLGDAIHTGATGTNVRDIRIMLAQATRS